MPKSELTVITVLRFAAAFYVFIFHIHIRWPLAHNGGVFDRFLSQGAVGMSIFFILSGFVLSISMSRSSRNFNSYLKSRIFRIYPVYFVAAVITLPWLFGSEEPNLILGVFLLLTNIFMIQAWLPQTFYFWNNGASWSISVEMFFYAILPGFLLLTNGLSIRKLAAVGLICVLLSAVIAISYNFFPPVIPSLVYYSVPVYRLPEFLVGVIIGQLFTKGYRIYYPSCFLIISLSSLCAVLCVPSLTGKYYFTSNYISVPLITLAIYSAACINNVNNRIIKPFIWFGHISYSFYAFQSLTILSLISYHDRIVSLAPIFDSNWLIFLVALSLTGLLAALSYELLEVRLRGSLERRFNRETNSPNEHLYGVRE